MNKRHFAKALALCAVSVMMLTGCSPRVVTDIWEKYPPLSAQWVRTYDVGDTVPNSSRSLGTVAVRDGGLTVDCGYDRMLQIAKEQTAATGGNALLLTEHLRPLEDPQKSSCHQLTGIMLAVSDTVIDPTEPNPVMEEARQAAEKAAQRLEELRVPSDIVRASFGPSWITTDVMVPGVGTYTTLGGWEATLQYQHFLSNGLGIGVNSSYYASRYKYVAGKATLSIFYIGPELSGALKLSKHWLVNLGIGLGYVHADDGTVNTSNGMGVNYKAGIDYMVSRHVGLGVEVNGMLTTMSKPDGVDEWFPKDKRYGFDRGGVLAGVRYYF